jgi:hypothetical protein
LAPAPHRVAIGFRPHSGWAALVAVAGTPLSPAVLDRRRVEMADPRIRGAAQPYHAAEGLTLERARELLERCSKTARRLACVAVSAAVKELRAQGAEVAGCGLLLGSGRPLTSLEKTLASHALIHTADGEHFRDALAYASESCGLTLLRVKERDLPALAAQQFGRPADELQRLVGGLGRSIGPPWRQDEKLAALIAWLALAESGAPR